MTTHSTGRSRRPLLAAATGLAMLTGACAGTTEPDDGRPAAELTALPRALSPAEVGVRDASNAFALRLFERASAGNAGKNVFVSPLSVSMSLGMAMNGAAGKTQEQMRATLGFGAGDLTAAQQGYRDLAALLRGLDPATSFQIANSIWHDRAIPFRASFLDAGRTWFDAEVRGVNFADAAGTKKQVNDWVAAKTNGRIPTIVDQVDPDDVMYLINAIWFKGNWRSKFDPAETRDAPFRTADGTTQTVRMMYHEGDSALALRHFADATVDAGELAYGNGAYAMTIVMPKSGSIDQFVGSLTAERWNAIVAGLRPRSGLDVYLPKFTLTFERELKDDLIALGMPDAFHPIAADFSGMSARDDLYIGFVKHKTFVQVDEEGTEAAAVTNTGIRVTSLPPSFRVDRPFVFAIRERLTGTVLFIGKMARVP